jgi:flagellar assembly protein FliH
LLDELLVLKGQREEERKALEEERRALRREAEQEADRARKKGREEGLSAGHKEGVSRGEAQVEIRVRQEYKDRFGQLLTLLTSVRESLERDMEALSDRNGPMLVRLWQAMLKRFIRREVEVDGETALRVFREVAARISDRTRIRIFLNPKDRDLYSAREREFIEIKRVAEQFDLIADEGIERGGCLIETNLGVYDARLRSQLEAVDREIEGIFQEGRSDEPPKG